MPINKSAVLVGIRLPGMRDFDQAFEELDNLALACDYFVVKKLTQNASKTTNNYYMGSGKVFELKGLLEETGAEAAIFDAELSPVHIRNLEQALQVKIIDRTMLILEIFESRAKTKEAKLQVALAKAQYMLPRLIDNENDLSGQTSGKGSKGKGEQKLELEKRRLRNNISKYRQELKDIVSARRTQRTQRNRDGLFVVSLVGYTNAGKSALMNQFLTISHRSEQKKVLEKDMLFATLQTTTRLISLQNLVKFLLVDTVGFVRRLPHHLLEAFKSTLEEVTEADLIIHVVDISDPEFHHHIQVVNDVLLSLGVADIPIVYALNKIDIIRKPNGELPQPSVKISALKGIGMPDLIIKISDYILEDYHPFVLKIPYSHADIVEKLKTEGIVMDTQYLPEDITVTVALKEKDVVPYQHYINRDDLN
jgi:GTP-binding protein HflX